MFQLSWWIFLKGLKYIIDEHTEFVKFWIWFKGWWKKVFIFKSYKSQSKIFSTKIAWLWETGRLRSNKLPNWYGSHYKVCALSFRLLKFRQCCVNCVWIEKWNRTCFSKSVSFLIGYALHLEFKMHIWRAN